MQPFWWQPIGTFLGLLLFALILTLAFGAHAGLLVLTLGLGLLLARNLGYLHKLLLWLAGESDELPPAEGPWGEVYRRLEAEFKAQRDSLARSRAEAQQMLQAARLLPDGVVMLDAQNRILWFNQAAQTLLGLKEKRDLGQFITYLVRSAAFATWLTDTDGGLLTLPGEDNRTLNLRLVPLPHAQKMLIVHDITELARVDAMRRDFVANVSHELRTPVTVIVGFLETFADMEEPDPNEFKRHIQLMREQSERIRRLLDDLLTLARLEADTEVPDETIDVNALARSLAQEAEGLSGGHHRIVLELQTEAGLRGSPKEIHSAFSNLVSNAVRYTPPGGVITLRWHESASGGAEFSVTDTGEGIAAQHIPRLTERFYRVDRGRSRATGGTGLGLAIVKHVLQRHQARLRIESTVGKGSTFTAVFPAERVIPAASTRPPASVPAAA